MVNVAENSLVSILDNAQKLNAVVENGPILLQGIKQGSSLLLDAGDLVASFR